MPPRALVALAALLAGCDDTLYARHLVEYEPDWLGVQAFTYNTCRQCHDAIADPSWPEGLEDDLLSGEEVYVVPGDPEASYFWRVLSNDDREPGEPVMPATGALPQDQIEFIEEWILAGAPL